MRRQVLSIIAKISFMLCGIVRTNIFNGSSLLKFFIRIKPDFSQRLVDPFSVNFNVIFSSD